MNTFQAPSCTGGAPQSAVYFTSSGRGVTGVMTTTAEAAATTANLNLGMETASTVGKPIAQCIHSEQRVRTHPGTILITISATMAFVSK